jgi:hypothetical protein
MRPGTRIPERYDAGSSHNQSLIFSNGFTPGLYTGGFARASVLLKQGGSSMFWAL